MPRSVHYYRCDRRQRSKAVRALRCHRLQLIQQHPVLLLRLTKGRIPVPIPARRAKIIRAARANLGLVVVGDLRRHEAGKSLKLFGVPIDEARLERDMTETAEPATAEAAAVSLVAGKAWVSSCRAQVYPYFRLKKTQTERSETQSKVQGPQSTVDSPRSAVFR